MKRHWQVLIASLFLTGCTATTFYSDTKTDEQREADLTDCIVWTQMRALQMGGFTAIGNPGFEYASNLRCMEGKGWRTTP